jgi:hypothetical protein
MVMLTEATSVGAKSSSMTLSTNAKTYAKGAVHTNSMDNFWFLLKRGLKRTDVSVLPYYGERCVTE